MRRVAWTAFTLVALGAAGAGGYWIGRHGISLPAALTTRLPTITKWIQPANKVSNPAASGPVIYYRDPDGKPFYSAEPRKTDDARDYLPVHASEDVSFDSDKKPVASSAEVTSNKNENKRILYYRNPMGLPDTSPVPKKDWMGMDYIAVYEGEEDDGSSIKVSIGKLQRAGVRSEPVTRHSITLPVRAPGTIQQDERRVAVIAMRSEAWIDKVENVTTGDHVHKGQPLFRVYSPAVATVAAEYVAALGTRNEAATLSKGSRQRLTNLAVPESVITSIERTREVPLVFTWSAPRDGVVIERNVSDGMRVTPGNVLFRIADHSVLWLLADVAERDLGLIAVGQDAKVRARSHPDRIFTGKVTLIYPHLMKETRTARLRIELSNEENLLRPEMYADVEIETGDGAPVIAVPDSAIIDTGTRKVVLLDKGEGRFEPREVKIGRRGNGLVEVQDGVAEGDAVVVSANFLIDAESNLKAALKGFVPGKPAP
jgi:Cu(I)/Ag(I) efflux system membrane fusion protein